MKSHENWSIKKWSENFSDLYSKVDSTRTPEQMWIAVLAHTSSIGESIRRVAFESLMISAAHTFCWLNSFVNRCNVLQSDIFSIRESLCGIASLKYPGICGHCKEKPCSCNPAKIDEERNKPADYKALLEHRKLVVKSFETYGIDDCMKVFRDIFGGRLHIQTLENIGFHFLEEIGEASVCIRQLSQLRKLAYNSEIGVDSSFFKGLTTVEGIVNNYVKWSIKPKELDFTSSEPRMLKARIVDAKMGLVIEIGDSFSWFFAILNKLDAISKSIFDKPKDHPDCILKPLDQWLIKEYIDSAGRPMCPSCRGNPCKCTFYNLFNLE